MSRTKGKRFASKKELEFSGNTSETKKEKKEKKIKKRKGNPIYNVIILICLAVIIYSVYNIIVWAIENKKNNDLLDDVKDIAGITHEEVVVDDLSIVKANYDFTELLKRNPDTVGWVYVPNTKIDYPVVQANDNNYYLTHSFDKSENSAGWIFADSSCNPKSSQNVVIYGHNRKDASMFGSLKSVQDDEWLSNIQNHYITFANLDGTGIYKIFSVFVANDEHVN